MKNYVTERELQCWRLTAQGKSSKEISEAMKITRKTVDSFREQLGRKIGARGICDLTRMAYEYCVVDAPVVTPLQEIRAGQKLRRFYLPVRKAGV